MNKIKTICIKIIKTLNIKLTDKKISLEMKVSMLNIINYSKNTQIKQFFETCFLSLFI